MIAYQKKLFIEIVHFLNNGLDLLTEGVWREHLQLVTMTQNLLNKIIGWCNLTIDILCKKKK
jgi:hypothetical protein